MFINKSLDMYVPQDDREDLGEVLENNKKNKISNKY